MNDSPFNSSPRTPATGDVSPIPTALQPAASAASQAQNDAIEGIADEDEEGRRRRQNVRVNVKYPITIHVSGHPGTKGRTRDLSATGVGFSTRLPLETEAKGVITVHFPTWDFSKEFVVRFIRPILAGRQVGAQYADLTEDERERVVKEVFAVQRAQLQAQRAKDRDLGLT